MKGFTRLIKRGKYKAQELKKVKFEDPFSFVISLRFKNSKFFFPFHIPLTIESKY